MVYDLAEKVGLVYDLTEIDTRRSKSGDRPLTLLGFAAILD
jgi:hypothetical protein